MELNDFVGTQLMKFRNVVEVGSQFAAVTDGNFDGAAFGKADGFRAIQILTKGRFHFVMGNAAGVKRDHERGVSRLKIAEPAGRLLLQETHQFQDALMRGQADFLAEINENGLVACRAESHRHLSELLNEADVCPGCAFRPFLDGSVERLKASDIFPERAPYALSVAGTDDHATEQFALGGVRKDVDEIQGELLRVMLNHHEIAVHALQFLLVGLDLNLARRRRLLWSLLFVHDVLLGIPIQGITVKSCARSGRGAADGTNCRSCADDDFALRPIPFGALGKQPTCAKLLEFMATASTKSKQLRWILFAGVLGLIVFSIVLGLLHEAPWIIPAVEKARKNPLMPTEANLAAAKQIYSNNCVDCHGEKGKGDGSDAMMYDPAPSDLTDVSKMSKLTDGEIYYQITEGRKPMPSFKKKLTEEQRWQLVLFVRSLAAGPNAAAPAVPAAQKPEPASKPK